MACYNISLRTPMTTASVIVAVLPLTTLLLGAVASSSIRLILWRARMIAQSLDDADIIIRHLLWNTETMMLDCSDEELHEAILQSAIDRGNETLAACYSNGRMSTTNEIAPMTTITTTTLDQSSSSSFSSSNDKSSDDEVDNHHDLKYNQQTRKNIQPQPMIAQVGGIATHKHPMLTLDQFILKPLRLLNARSSINVTKKYESEAENDEGTNYQAMKGPKHKVSQLGRGMKNNLEVVDSTNDFRGIRELAFYESLAFASSVPLPPEFQRMSDEDFACNAHSTLMSWAMMRLLSRFKTRVSTKECFLMQQSSHIPTILRKRNHPMTLFNLSRFDTTILLSAYYAGDSVVVSRIQSFERAWHAMIRELEALKRLTQFTAPYFGVVYLDVEQHPRNPLMKQPHLLLQNLITPFRQPNIIDIKMGTRTYEPSAPLSKQISQAAKYPQQLVLGFRIVGMGMHMSDGTYQCWDKSFGVTLKRGEDVIAAMMSFFQCDNSSTNKSYIRYVLACVIHQLNQIQSWFEVDNSSLVFYASSILIAYDTSVQVDDESFGNGTEPVVKMIDFAHVCRRDGGDHGYMKGVRSLLKILHAVNRKIL